MGLLRDLECKLFHRSPIVDCNNRQKYPLKSVEELQFMNDYLCANWDKICVFPFVQITDNDKYIEIYVWEKFLCPKPFVRFILHEGERLPDEEEELYLKYFCSDEETSKFSVDAELWERFNAAVVSAFPQWHYSSCDVMSIDMALLHIYYASHRSGPREILFKANLDVIAQNIEGLTSYVNIIGTTPSEILGGNASIRFLRMMNRPNFAGYFLRNSELCIQVYNEFSGYIGVQYPSTGQWAYLINLYQKRDAFTELSFSRTIYNRLQALDGEIKDSLVVAYKFSLYYKVCTILKREKGFRIPSSETLFNVMGKIDWLGQYLMPCLETFSDYRKRKEFEHDMYEYSEEKYSVIFPDSPYDMCVEAIAQSNCLKDYIRPHARKKTTILFVRKNSDSTMPFVTIEIRNGKVNQVYAAYNKLPNIEVYEFLIRYCKVKRILIDVYTLVLDGMHSNEDVPSDLKEYANSFRKERENTGKNKCGRHTLSDDDLAFRFLDNNDDIF